MALSVDWLARGRSHREAGRIVDAWICFQHAVKAAPKQPEPRFHLGLAVRALGREREAIAIWREAASLAPADHAIHVALAEALLAVGDAADARTAAATAREAQPDDARGGTLEAVAGWLDGTPPLAPAALVAEAVARDPGLVSDAALAVPLARALDSRLDLPGRDALVDVALQQTDRYATMPVELLAILAEVVAVRGDTCASRAVFAAAERRDVAAGDQDALRRIARAAARVGSSSAPMLARRYGELCAGAFAPAVALLWPQRTAGARLRVVALIGPSAGEPAVAETIAGLATLPQARFDVRYAGWPEAGSVAAIKTTGATPTPCLALSGTVDEQARRVAALDPDVIVDLVGLESPCGPLLAARPARAVLALDALQASAPTRLRDRSFADAGDLVAHLEIRHRHLPVTPAGFPDAAGMVALWDEVVLAHQRREWDAALAGYGRVLVLQPGFAPAHFLRGMLNRESGDLAAARTDFAAALSIAPNYTQARIAAVNAALAADRPQDAAALCASGGESGEPSAALLRSWGLAELALRRADVAAGLFARALALDPADGDTHYNYGVARQMLHEHAEAARAYQRALAVAPDLSAAAFNLGVLFQEKGAADAAIAAYSTVLAQDERHVAAYRNLGETLLASGRVDAALENFRRFEANCPDALALAVQALEVCQHHGDFASIDHYLEGLACQRFRATDDRELCDELELLLYLLLFFDVEPSLVFRYATIYDAALRRLQGPPPPPPATRRTGRIRVGYLSADLRDQVMGKMVWQEVMHHDRSNFELHFYALSSQRDEWTRKFERIADSYVTLADVDDREAAARIREDDLDLLVDLSTHTKGARPGILALKPARVLVTHVANAGAVGLSTIDFKLTDHLADVPASQQHQVETLLPVDGCVYPFRRVAAASDHPFKRGVLGVAADDVLVGAFFTPLKLSRRCLALWRMVLDRVPRARLAFSPANPAFRDSYVRLAGAGGIAADRLIFVPQGRSEAENQARYALIDFVLDPMPYGGVNGTVEALGMEVPVVTLVGTRHGERTSLSILANLGATQTIANTPEQYVALAVRLASDPLFLHETKAAIRFGLAKSPLTDAVAHTRNVEAAYRRALALRAPYVLAEASPAPMG